MSTPPFRPIAAAAIAAHFADQMLLAGLPLLLTAGGQSARIVSLVVAAHAAAWLLVSLPVGAFADRVQRRSIVQGGAAAVCLGAVLPALAATNTPAIYAGAAFILAAGVVAIVLAIFALLPRTVAAERLPSANAALEFGRASTVVVAPSLAAYLIAANLPTTVFWLALAAGLVALAATRFMTAGEVIAPKSQSLATSIAEGAAFVAREPLLRAIAICAIFWNSAFFGLTAVFVPYAVKTVGLTLAQAGQAWSVYGAGLLLGAVLAPLMIARLPTGFMFVFGPILSAAGVLAMLLLAPSQGLAPVWFAFFCVGFGPMTWLVLQTSVRQIVTPPDKLGRVGATITTAIYGVRPLGALAAGEVAHAAGMGAALGLVAVLFAASALAIVLSPAAKLRVMPTRAVAGATL
jgi:predicted MFS family arabinose efflux permease